MFHFTTPDMQVFHFTTYMQVCGVVQEPWIGSQSVLQIAKKNKQQIESLGYLVNPHLRQCLYLGLQSRT